MARPRSDERRSAILASATRVIASDGLSAPTATIAKEAGVSNGSLFVYFATKADLFNALYVELKTEMGAAAVDGLTDDVGIRDQMLRMWNNWLHWATLVPEKRRALAQLDVSDEISAESHRVVSGALSGVARLLELARANGPTREASLGFALALTSAVADATIDSILREPEKTDLHGAISFDVIWRMLA